MLEDRADIPPLDREAAAVMWRDYATAHPEVVQAAPEHTVEAFGDSAELADRLLAYVLEGPKRATSSLLEEFALEGEPLPRIGSHWSACDGRGIPRVVLRTVQLGIGTFHDVDADYAAAEGEDDRTLESWRSGHLAYWRRGCAARGMEFDEHRTPILFERFRVVWPAELAD